MDAADTVEVVLLPLGVTVNVYDVPFVSPATVQLCAPAVGGVTPLTLHVAVPGEAATVYRVATPSAVKLTVIAPLPARTAVGAVKAAAPANEAVPRSTSAMTIRPRTNLFVRFMGLKPDVPS
jgi:hypothetical protein